MPRSKGAAARRRKAAAARKAAGPPKAVAVAVPDPDAGRPCPNLSLDVLANIHDRLPFLDRLAFASVFGETCYDVFQPGPPCLLLPGKTPETARLFSLADGRAASAARVPDPAMRGHVVLGSNRGWIATADESGQIYLANPTTGAQHALPHIATMGVFLPEKSNTYRWFSLVIRDLLAARYGAGPPFLHLWGPEGYGTFTHSAAQMRMWFYRKVVLSDSPRPGTYAAMLILEASFGAPAFATADDPTWRLAKSPDGVEDAIFHHDGRFYSVSYTGLVESWERDAETGQFKSAPAAPRLSLPAVDKGGPPSRKYLAVAPGGRLAVVLKYADAAKERSYGQEKGRCVFEVRVLGDGGAWEETTEIGEAALFVGANNSMCVSTKGRPGIMAGCVYYTDDEHGQAALRQESRRSSYSYNDDESADLRGVGVFCLKRGSLKGLELGTHYVSGSWPPPAWITPSIP